MARKGGNPDIKKFCFTPETARKAAQKSRETRKQKAAQWRSVRSLIDSTAPVALRTAGVIEFWKAHGVDEKEITPMMAEITPIYADAIKNHDIDALERIYKLFGLAFDSTKEQNLKVAFENHLQQDVDIKGGLTLEIVEKKPEPINEA